MLSSWFALLVAVCERVGHKIARTTTSSQHLVEMLSGHTLELSSAWGGRGRDNVQVPWEVVLISEGASKTTATRKEDDTKKIQLRRIFCQPVVEDIAVTSVMERT